MSKSLGTCYTISDIEAKGYSGLDLRFFFFMALYSTFQNFTREAISQAKSTRANLQKKITKLRDSSLPLRPAQNDELVGTLAELAEKYPQSEKLIDLIDEAIKDNLNTPKLLAVVNNALTSPSNEDIEVLYRLEKKFLKV
jgi:cysteinyl-tRNA synthetase